MIDNIFLPPSDNQGKKDEALVIIHTCTYFRSHIQSVHVCILGMEVQVEMRIRAVFVH